MKQPLLVGGALLAGLVLGHPAQAQSAAAPTVRTHCHSPQRDTTKLTERNNRLAMLAGVLLVRNRHSNSFGGLEMEVGYAVRPRLTLGARGLFTARTASLSNYGLPATNPALSYRVVLGAARYQLLNTRHWRLDGVAGLGLGWVVLADRDQQVTQQVYYGNYGYYATETRPATVATSLHLALETGLSLSYKLRRDVWLTSRLSYAQLPGRNSFGAANEFSYWQASLGVSVPWGWQ